MNRNLSPQLTEQKDGRSQYMTLEIHVLAWHRDKTCGGINRWMRSQLPFWLMDIQRQYIYKQTMKNLHRFASIKKTISVKTNHKNDWQHKIDSRMFKNVHLETTYIVLWEENYKIIKFLLNKANIGIGLMLFCKGWVDSLL